LKKNESSLEKLELSAEELESFVSPEAEEDKSIAPFMPYYDPKALTVTVKDAAAKGKDTSSEASEKGYGSFQNLKKLNEELEQNQKRRR
jgi:hypothetical protein